MDSKYAPAKRQLKETILESNRKIKDSPNLDEFISSLPYVGTILNSDRQVVYSNEALLKKIGVKVEKIIGQRPGEFLSCVNANNEIGGCGTSENCSVCGAVNTILQCQKTNEPAEGECVITTGSGIDLVIHEFRVNTTPINLSGENYMIFTLFDISEIKRGRMLEQIFFHDIINKAGNLKSLASLLKQIDNEDKLKQMVDLVYSISDEMLEEILAQRQLKSAETNELIVEKSTTNTQVLVQDLVTQIQYHNIASDKLIIIDGNFQDFEITTDQALLKRVISNMLKNALEASKEDQLVTIGCKESGTDKARIWVHNKAFIPEKLQLQIFKRSFSTKGANRGLGTYSIKLLGEKYLKGDIGFSSDKNKGTLFYIELPINTNS